MYLYMYRALGAASSKTPQPFNKVTKELPLHLEELYLKLLEVIARSARYSEYVVLN